MFDGLEMGIFPLVARPALQEFQHAAGIVNEAFVQMWMGRITATFLLGAAAGGLVFGWLGDRIGRVRAMMLSVPSPFDSPTTTQIFEVPISNPTTMLSLPMRFCVWRIYW